MDSKKKVEKSIELEICDRKEYFLESFQCPICKKNISFEGGPLWLTLKGKNKLLVCCHCAEKHGFDLLNIVLASNTIFNLKKEMTELKAINIENYSAVLKQIQYLCHTARTAWEDIEQIVQLKALKSAQTMLDEGVSFKEIKINGIDISVKDGVAIKDNEIPF